MSITTIRFRAVDHGEQLVKNLLLALPSAVSVEPGHVAEETRIGTGQPSAPMAETVGQRFYGMPATTCRMDEQKERGDRPVGEFPFHVYSH
jgi:hypothetical protein